MYSYNVSFYDTLKLSGAHFKDRHQKIFYCLFLAPSGNIMFFDSYVNYFVFELNLKFRFTFLLRIVRIYLKRVHLPGSYEIWNSLAVLVDFYFMNFKIGWDKICLWRMCDKGGSQVS